MIHIQRSEEPYILRLHCEEWTQDFCSHRRAYYQALSEYENGLRNVKPKPVQADKRKYAHQDIKKSLERMFGGKCAYCESEVIAVSYQHIEHFRPQSIYPLLAYQWHNLLFACEKCNSAFKKEKFPLRDGNQPVVDTQNPCSLDDSDSNALIDPCIDNPEDFFDFTDPDGILKSQNTDPRSENYNRARYTIDICGLNREYLQDQRRKHLARMKAVIEIFLMATERSDKATMRKCAEAIQNDLQCTAPYYAVTKAILKTKELSPLCSHQSYPENKRTFSRRYIAVFARNSSVKQQQETRITCKLYE